ncbi:transposase [Streptomyces sp. NPDC057136]|uniref:transposase n=1 Tax=Streptomyces sp. NPDC057136 TaxID=3346029 RepID=UPI0036277F73
MLDAVRYVVDNGVKWADLPADFPPYRRVHAFARRRQVTGSARRAPRPAARQGPPEGGPRGRPDGRDLGLAVGCGPRRTSRAQRRAGTDFDCGRPARSPAPSSRSAYGNRHM